MARKTIAAEDITVTVLVDEMDNALTCTYGPAPDNAYLIGTDGTIIAKQGWYQPDQMEAVIAEYLSSAKYICTVCDYVYDLELGDPDGGIKPGTPFEEIPDDWVCPICMVGKSEFEKLE